MQKALTPPRPWYKEPWPWILMAFPVASVIVGIFFFQAAVRSDDGLVTDDYYTKGKAINMELKRDNVAANLGITGQVMVGADGRAVRISTTSKKPLPDTLHIKFIHPAQDDFDGVADIHKVADNLYQGELNQPLVNANHWYVQVEDKAKQWRIVGEWKPKEGTTVLLGQPKLEPAE